jgi:hypothetical protein
MAWHPAQQCTKTPKPQRPIKIDPFPSSFPLRPETAGAARVVYCWFSKCVNVECSMLCFNF